MTISPLAWSEEQSDGGLGAPFALCGLRFTGNQQGGLQASGAA